MVTISSVKENQIPLLAEKASEVWHEWFPRILSVEQIDYMVEKFQSPSAIERQLKEGYEYFFLQPAGEVGGYICLKPYPDYLFLSKFYILKEYRGKGYGKKAFEFMVDYAKRHNLNKIKVSVNKYNVNSIAVYEKLGFCRGQATCTDIGNGFVMDDYEYICEL